MKKRVYEILKRAQKGDTVNLVFDCVYDVYGVASQPLTNYLLCGEGKAMLDIKKYHINFDNKMKTTNISENPCWFR